MRNLLKIVGISLVVMTLALGAPDIHAAKKMTTEEQVAVLMKWYHTYFDQGNYKQAEQVAELARELAPHDPEIAVALMLARRQQAKTASKSDVELQLERVLGKLDRVERQLRIMDSTAVRRTRLQIAKEPPGSPDAFPPPGY